VGGFAGAAMPDAQVLGVVYTLSIDTAVFVIAFAYWLLRQRAARRVRRVSSRSDECVEARRGEFGAFRPHLTAPRARRRCRSDANELLDGPELEGDEAAVALQPLAEPAPAPAPAAAAAGNGAVDGSERDGARRASESEGSGGGDATATAAALAAEALSPSRLLARLFSPSAVRSVDGLVYLRFQQWSVVAVVALCVYGLLVLVPVFGSGDYVGIKETLLEHLSVGNIRLASPRLWAVFVGYLLVTAAGYALVAAFLADVKRSASRFPVHVMRLFMEPRTVHVFGMSRELVDGEAVRRFLHRVLPGQSESVQLALDVSDLSSLLTARASLRREIERCRAIEARSGRAQLRWCGRGECCCCRCPPSLSLTHPLSRLLAGSLLQHLMAREAELNRSIRDERLRPRRGSGHAFIVFRGAPAVDSLRSVFRAFLDDARDVRMRRGGTPEADDPIGECVCVRARACPCVFRLVPLRAPSRSPSRRRARRGELALRARALAGRYHLGQPAGLADVPVGALRGGQHGVAGGARRAHCAGHRVGLLGAAAAPPLRLGLGALFRAPGRSH
jgi:hypothetical protein